MEQLRKIVADRDIPYLKGVLEPFCEVAYIDGASISAEDIRDADALIVRTRTKCDAALLDRSNIKLIATATIGCDHIDAAYCRQRGITVATSAGCNARAVLQYVMAAISVLSRGSGRAGPGGISNGEWMPQDKTLGIIGVGSVGSAVKRLAEALGFRVLCCDPPRMDKEPELDFMSSTDLLPECDIVSCHVPLTYDGLYPTINMAGREFFEAMKNDAIFINTSRGEICDEQALCRDISSGRLTAVIDTWREEPRINRELLELARFTTPHIAGYSQEGKARGTAMAVDSVVSRFSLPLTGWYPPGAPRSHENLSITWSGIVEKMPYYFDIVKESAELKAAPDSFELFRNSYSFRRESF